MLINPLSGNFGAEVVGLDLRQALAPDTVGRLVEALHQHRLIVIRDQHLSEDQYLAFGRHWGRPHPHLLDHKRMPGYPEMMVIGNTQKRAPGDNPAVFWHTDQSYEAEPASATMLYAVMAPEVGGETLLADMVAAYRALDDQTKTQIAGLRALHLYGAASGQGGELTASVLISDDQRKASPAVPHPIVRPHPATGEKTLYAVAGTPFAIEGMEREAALALLARLKAHATSPPFVHAHKYRVGDIAIWDTAATLHSATPLAPATCVADSRLLWRISVKGLPAVLQQKTPAAELTVA